MDRGASPADVGADNSIFGRDRRRARRHRVHTPAYASLTGSAQGAVLELSEILDISESGMCIQSSSPMKVNRLLPLCLDLSETGARIHVVGHVVWSDPLGRTGIRFPDMSDASRRQLVEWLEANAKVEAAFTTSMTPLDPGPAAAPAAQQTPKPGASAGYTSLVNEWAEIDRDIEICGPDLDPALHLVAQRALTLTWASGTAIALINKSKPSEMICRARAGTDSPEIGARLESGSGFSGECVRSGKTITCDDTEYDTRVDRRSCRALGIRSIVATPVKRGDEIVGILEIFSPEPAAFWENDITILQRLAGFISRAVHRAEHVRSDVLSFSQPEEPSFQLFGHTESSDTPDLTLRPPASTTRRITLLLIAVTCVTAVIWMSAHWIAELGHGSSSFNVPTSAAADSSAEGYATWTVPDLAKRANQGDARAEYALGMRYANGTEVKQDYRQAKQWFLRAADQGHVSAQEKVAASFFQGRGGPQDYGRAYYWGLLAQAGGDETSRQIVMSCADHLSPAQISAEHKQADQWLHSHHIGHSSD
jgi:GAF domain-containing protein